MKIESHQRRFKAFSLFSEKTQTFSVKMAVVFLNSYLHSKIIEVLALILEYAQLASQTILLYPSLYSNASDNSDNYPFQRKLIYAAKLINPSYLLSYGEQKDSTESILLLIMCWTILKYCMIIYVSVATSKNQKSNPIMLKLFKLSLQLQSKVVYYFVTSFFFRCMIATKENGFTFLGIGKAGNTAVCIIIIFIELFLAGFPKYRFHYLLPTKSFLASKNNTVENITLFQKFLIQLLQLLLSQTAIASKWILIIVNLILTLARAFKYFIGLPFYKINALLLQAALVGIIASLHFVSLINLILISKGTIDEGVTFLFVAWIILALLSIKASQGLLMKIIFKVLTENNYSFPELLVYKVELIKQFLKRQKLPSKLGDYNDWSHLVVNSIQSNLNQVFFIESPEFQLSKKSDQHKLFLPHLETIVQKHPKSGFAKLYLAFFYGQKAKAYSKAISLIEEIRSETFSRIYLNACYLLSEMQKSIRSDYLGNKDQIDIYTYVQSQVQLDQLKETILKQIDSQSSVYEELLNNNSNLDKIFKDSQSAYSHKKQAVKRIKDLVDYMPEFYVRPLVLFAHYNLIINQSPYDYEKFYEMYNLRNQKYKKYFKSERLCEQNIYQDTCALFVVSGQKADSGKVISCNYNVKRVLGGDPQWYIGSKVHHRICTPSLRPMSENFYRSLSEPESLAIFNQTSKSFAYNKEGYVFETDFHLNIYPSLSLGYFVALFLRPAPDKKDFMLVRENGEIEGASRKICKRLGIFQADAKQKGFYISEFSPELAKVTEAVNIISDYDRDKIKYDVNITIKNQVKERNVVGQKPPNIFIEEAQRLFSLYTERGNEVVITPSSKHNDSTNKGGYRYFCKVANLVFDSVVVRLFMLEEIENDNESELDEIIEKISFVEETSEKEDLVKQQDSTASNHNEESSHDWNVNNQEKELGWIDFGILQARRLNSQTPLMKSEESVKIPTEIPFERKKKSKGLTRVIKREQNMNKLKLNLENKTQTEIDNQTKPQQDTTRNNLGRARIAESVKKSISSLKSGTNEVSKTLKTALESRQSSKNFKTVLLFFITLLVFFFAIIILLFTNLDNTIESLKLKKDVMLGGQKGGYYIFNIQPIIRTTHDLAVGVISTSDFEYFKNPLPSFVSLVNLYAQQLEQANQELITLVNDLDNDFKKNYYLPNVKMAFVDSYQEMTGFQAIDSIVQEVFKMAQDIKSHQTVDEDAFNLLLYNLVNDVILKNRVLVGKSLASVQDQADSVIEINTTSTAVICSCTFLLICLLLGITWLQFHRKRSNLTHLTKLSSHGLQAILDNSKLFKETLLQDGNFKAQELQTFEEKGKNRIFLNQKKNHRNKQNFIDSPVHSAIQNQFILYGFKSVLLCIILTVSLLTGTFFIRNSMNYTRKKLEQIHFINLIGNRVCRTIIATLELPAANGTTYIEGMKTSVAIHQYIAEMTTLRTQLMETFMDLEIVQDYQTSQLIFGNACEILGAAELTYCNVLNSKTTNSSLAQLLGAFETLLIERTDDYENSDKSAAALKANRMLNYDLLVAMKRVISDSCIFVAGLLDQDFEDKLDTLDGKRKFGLCFSIISLFVTAGVMWILVLRPIKDVDNNFKKTLQIFPAKMILSNFPLRIFLLENSNIDANFIKNMS